MHLEKDIKPIIIDEDGDYKKLLLGIFNSNNRALNLYNEQQVCYFISQMIYLRLRKELKK